MTITRLCGRCGKRIAAGSKCECIKQSNKERYAAYDKKRTDKEVHNFYNTTEWKKLRQWAIYHFKNIDIYSFYILGKLEYGQTVHHIVPIKDDWSKRLNKNNLIYLTHKNHQLIHERMKNDNAQEVINELVGLIQRFEKEFC